MNLNRKLLLPTFACFLALVPQVAAAGIIDFEDVTPIGVSGLDFGALTNTTISSGGFVFDSPDNSITNHAHLIGSPFNNMGSFPNQHFYPMNGTQYIGMDTSIITMSSTAPFNLLSFDAAEGFLIDPDFGIGGTDTSNAFLVAPADRLEVVGTFAAGGTIVAEFSFDGINDSIIGTADDFQSFVLPAGFVGLTSVSFHGLDAAGQRRQELFSIDNIAVSTTTVPEPSMNLAIVVALSMGGIVRLSKRSR